MIPADKTVRCHQYGE